MLNFLPSQRAAAKSFGLPSKETNDVVGYGRRHPPQAFGQLGHRRQRTGAGDAALGRGRLQFARRGVVPSAVGSRRPRGRHQPDRHGGAVSHSVRSHAAGGRDGGDHWPMAEERYWKKEQSCWRPKLLVEETSTSAASERTARALKRLGVDTLDVLSHWRRGTRPATGARRRAEAVDATPSTRSPRRSIARVRLGPGGHHGAERCVVPRRLWERWAS